MTAVTSPVVPNVVLDLRGQPNPEPILGLANAANLWRGGDVVRVVSDDSCFANDFLRWCSGRALDIISLRYLPGGETELTVRVPRGAGGCGA
jgi:TusA-related sulfurtransferase